MYSVHLNSFAFPATRRPRIRPKRPRIELKISITRILTNLGVVSMESAGSGGRG